MLHFQSLIFFPTRFSVYGVVLILKLKLKSLPEKLSALIRQIGTQWIGRVAKRELIKQAYYYWHIQPKIETEKQADYVAH